MNRFFRPVLACAFFLCQIFPTLAGDGNSITKISTASTVPKLQSNLRKSVYNLEDQLAYLQNSATTSLAAILSDGKVLTCPLTKTRVNADVSGYVARVRVDQTFTNPSRKKFEAVYTFPLPANCAVDRMWITVGPRSIRGAIREREEARNIYQSARAEGRLASLLEQERPNIFTQSISNVEPGQAVVVTLEYVQLLAYEHGSYNFVFPMVVGPRFIPQGLSLRHDYTHRAPRLPSYVPPGMRPGHDISIRVHIDAGMSLSNICSAQHPIKVENYGTTLASVGLADQNTIPNKDFVLSWEVASQQIKSGYLCHKTGKQGYLSLMIMPPKTVAANQRAPKEMIFIVDTSGSMSGSPIEQCKQTMRYVLNHLDPRDTFEVIAFNSTTCNYPQRPAQATQSNLSAAWRFIHNLDGCDGTYMGPAVEAACALVPDENRLRIVTMMTDGNIGNDAEIISMVRRLRGKSRWFPFGIGYDVNDNLIHGMAKAGGGESQMVSENADSKTVAKSFFSRIASPVLTDVKVRFHGLKVAQVFPNAISDVWEQKPLYFQGTYNEPGEGYAEITGFLGGKPYKQRIPIALKATQPANDAIESIWARAKVDSLLDQTSASQDINRKQITAVALAHHIVSPYTSFVAVENKLLRSPGKPMQRFDVSANEGTTWERQNEDPNEGTTWDIRRHYFMRFPVVGAFGPNSAGGHVVCGGRIRHSKSGHVFLWPTTIMDSADPYPKLPTQSDTLGSQQAQAAHIDHKVARVESLASLRITPPSHHHRKTHTNSLPYSRKFSSSVQLLILMAVSDGSYPERIVPIKLKTNTECPSLLAELKRLGLSSMSQNRDGTVFGTIPLRLLKHLAALPEITSIDLVPLNPNTRNEVRK